MKDFDKLTKVGFKNQVLYPPERVLESTAAFRAWADEMRDNFKELKKQRAAYVIPGKSNGIQPTTLMHELMGTSVDDLIDSTITIDSDGEINIT